MKPFKTPVSGELPRRELFPVSEGSPGQRVGAGVGSLGDVAAARLVPLKAQSAASIFHEDVEDVPSVPFKAVIGSLVLAESAAQAERLKHRIGDILGRLRKDTAAIPSARNDIVTLCTFLQDMATGYANLENVDGASAWLEAQLALMAAVEQFKSST